VDTQESALKTLIRERHLTYESFCREWDRVARGVDDHLVSRWPGRAQYYRWLRGELVNGHPYPDACRMLEAMSPAGQSRACSLPIPEAPRNHLPNQIPCPPARLTKSRLKLALAR